MGQSRWVGGCALFAMLAGATWLEAQERKREVNPFDGGGEAALATVAPAAAKEKAGDKPAAAAGTSCCQTKAAQRIQHALDQPLKNPADFLAQPLRTVMGAISEQYEIPIQFDTKALDAVAVTPDQEVTIQISNVRLRSALDLMLRNAGAEQLTYLVNNEVLLITTEEEAQKRLEVCVYRVDDLLTSPMSKDDLDELIDIVTSNVEHDSWQENGTGEGEIKAFQPAMLIVSNTQRAHEQLERLLGAMRQTKKGIEKSLLAQDGGQRLITRGIAFDDKSIADSNENRALLQDIIVHSVDWAPGGQDVENSFLHVLPNHVIVRHQPRVVDQVEQIVRSIMGPRSMSPHGSSGNDAKASHTGGMGGRGRGGFGGTANAKATAAVPASRPGFF